jgi:hypothetical protein
MGHKSGICIVETSHLNDFWFEMRTKSESDSDASTDMSSEKLMIVSHARMPKTQPQNYKTYGVRHGSDTREKGWEIDQNEFWGGEEDCEQKLWLGVIADQTKVISLSSSCFTPHF